MLGFLFMRFCPHLLVDVLVIYDNVVLLSVACFANAIESLRVRILSIIALMTMFYFFLVLKAV